MARYKHPLEGVKELLRKSLLRLGYSIYRLRDEDRRQLAQKSAETQTDGVFRETDYQRLAELRRRYAALTLPVVQHSVWQTRGRSGDVTDMGWGQVDMLRFRDHSAYIYSYLRSNPFLSRLIYFVYADAVRQMDSLRLLDRLHEDGAFGCQTCEYPGLGKVSRDRLDSVREIGFLNQHLRILESMDFRVLDIGAGYGRMAHRLLTAHPGLAGYTCVDAIAESTFLSEFYLRHRGLAGKARVVPLHEVEQHFAQRPRYQLALNIHSFSECTYAAVEWWLTQVANLQIPYLMIVPNESEQFLATEPDRSRRDFLPMVEKLGYRLKAKAPLFTDPAVRELLSVQDHLFLFERAA